MGTCYRGLTRPGYYRAGPSGLGGTRRGRATENMAPLSKRNGVSPCFSHSRDTVIVCCCHWRYPIKLPIACAWKDRNPPGVTSKFSLWEGYRSGELSQGQVSELLGMGFDETEAFLKEHGADVGLTMEEFEQDSANLRQFLAR